VNIECDILAKYVEALLDARRAPGVSGLRVDELMEQGF